MDSTGTHRLTQPSPNQLNNLAFRGNSEFHQQCSLLSRQCSLPHQTGNKTQSSSKATRYACCNPNLSCHSVLLPTSTSAKQLVCCCHLHPICIIPHPHRLRSWRCCCADKAPPSKSSKWRHHHCSGEVIHARVQPAKAVPCVNPAGHHWRMHVQDT